MAGQKHDVTPETWDSMIPQILQNVSEAGRKTLHDATRPTQPTNQFFSLGVDEMESWMLEFLSSLANSPGWENTVSLVNEHHQTLAHLAVLFQYTTLLKKVAQWGIDVDVQDVNGFTALHCAYMRGDLDSVRVLKRYGADEDIEDNLGRQPVHMYTQITNDLGKSSPSSDRTSSLVQISSVWEEQREVSMTPFQSAHSSDNETTTDLLDKRHEPLRTCESTTTTRVMVASMAVPSFVCDNSFATEEAGVTDGVSEIKSSLSIPVERIPSPTAIQSLPVTTPEYARSYKQELEELRAIAPSAIHTRRDLQPSVPENTGTWHIHRAPASPEVGLSSQEDNSLALCQVAGLGLTAPLTEHAQSNSTHLPISDHGDSFASSNSSQANPPDTQARMGISTTQPSRSQYSVLSLGPGNESSRIAIADNIALANRDWSLRKLERIIDASAWLRDNEPEPRIGNPDCPAEANHYGLRGESVFTAFVEDHEDGTYGCKRQLCHVYSTRSLDEAIRHQRHHHFNHAPYVCVPASGSTWYVSSLPLVLCTGRTLADPLFSAVAASLLKWTSRITSKGARSRLSK